MSTIKPTQRVCLDVLHHQMQNKPLSQISVQEIIEESGISKATFYRHFTGKEDLFTQMISRDLNFIFTDDCNLDQWIVRVIRIIETFRQEKKILYRLSRNDPAAFHTFYTNVMYELFLKRLYRIHGKDYIVSPSLRRRLLYMCAGTSTVLQDWLTGDCIESNDTIAHEIAALFAENAHQSPLQNSAPGKP